MTTPNSLQWTADVVHTLIHYPQRLLEHAEWGLVIAELGGVKPLHQQLLTYPLKIKERRLLEALMIHPKASVEYYCDLLAIHPATFHRQQNALCQHLSGLLPSVQPEAPVPETWQLFNASTSLLGRTLDLERIQLLFDQGCFWINLVGMGGVGKTRLAMEFSQRIVPMFRDGVGIVGLSDWIEPNQLAQHCIQQLGLVDQPSAEPNQILQAYLSTRHMLLVLDNLQRHDLAAWFVDLFQAAPFIRVISTGGQRLNVPHERLHHVEPLSYPAADCQISPIEHYPALQLLCERLPTSSTLDQMDEQWLEGLSVLCRELAGHPLALELAVSLDSDVPTLIAKIQQFKQSLATPQPEMLLSSLIQWNYARLDPSSQQLLARLATLPAAATKSELATLSYLNGLELESALIAAQRQHLLLDYGTHFAIPSSVQTTIRAINAPISHT